MPSNALWPLVIVVILAVGLGFVNGFNDTANAIATVVGTRVLSPRTAIILATVLNGLGCLTGVAVARTIGKGILIPQSITYEVCIAGLVSIVLWGIVATLWGLPISLTHGFIAGLAGAGWAIHGFNAVVWKVLLPIILWVFGAPLLAFIAGFIVMAAIYWIFRRGSPKQIDSVFRRLQVLSASFMAYSHGLNDGQNPMAVILMGMVIYTGSEAVWDNVPAWPMWLSAISMAIGTAMGGWQVIQTLGMKVTTLHPVNGFAAELAAAGVIWLASIIGVPISTTHAISASIFGVGATSRYQAVRWGVAGNIIAAWVLTFPLCGGLSYIIALILKTIFVK
jgi:PiT family inorganic phosphate transporter